MPRAARLSALRNKQSSTGETKNPRTQNECQRFNRCIPLKKHQLQRASFALLRHRFSICLIAPLAPDNPSVQQNNERALPWGKARRTVAASHPVRNPIRRRPCKARSGAAPRISACPHHARSSYVLDRIQVDHVAESHDTPATIPLPPCMSRLIPARYPAPCTVVAVLTMLIHLGRGFAASIRRNSPLAGLACSAQCNLGLHIGQSSWNKLCQAPADA